jgi:hypothetical protein
MRADDADARASRLCEYGATGTGKNQGLWGGAARDATALGNCGRFLGFLEAPLDVSVDPIVKFIRERSGEIGPSVSRQIEQSTYEIVEQVAGIARARR